MPPELNPHPAHTAEPPWSDPDRRLVARGGTGGRRGAAHPPARRYRPVEPAGAASLRMRRPGRLPPDAARRGAAENRGAGARGAADLPRASTFRSLRAAPAPACPAARCRTACGVVLSLAPIQSHPRHRPGRAHGARAAGRAQSRRSRKPPRRTACTTRPIRPRRSPARSAATSRRTPAACIA